jgi:hypothetical protein
MINYLKNLFKKKTEPEPIAPVVPKNFKYKEEISLNISYTEYSDGSPITYKTYQTIESDDYQIFCEKRNAIFKEYQQTIDKIHKDMKDDSTDPMLVVADNMLLIKKSDFINAKILKI